MLSQGLNLMLYGMGTVFVFLTLLVICTTAMSSVISKFFPAGEAADPTPVRSVQAPTDRKLIAIIEAAIAEHRK